MKPIEVFMLIMMAISFASGAAWKSERGAQLHLYNRTGRDIRARLIPHDADSEMRIAARSELHLDIRIAALEFVE